MTPQTRLGAATHDGMQTPEAAQRPRAGAPRPIASDRARAWARYAAGMAVVALVAWMLSGDEYWLGLVTSGLLFAGLASAWNIIGGFGGQFSLGHGVFFALGAYAVVLLQTQRGWSPWLALALGVALAVVVALVLAWPLFRLRGPFFAIGTLALNEVALALANYFDWTGGPRGARIPFTESAITDRSTWMWVMFAYLALAVAVTTLLVRSRLGYYLVAVRDEEDAADAAGANPLTVKTLGLLISAGLTGLGGGLFAMYIAYVDPHTVLAIAEIGARIPLLVLIGGIGTIAGPVVGALIVQPGEMYLRGELASLPPGTSLVVLGALFVLAARFFPRGIWGGVNRLTRRFRQRG